MLPVSAAIKWYSPQMMLWSVISAANGITTLGVSAQYYELINNCEGFHWFGKSCKDSIRGSFSTMNQLRNENLALHQQVAELFKEIGNLKSESSDSRSVATISSPPSVSSSPSPPPHHPAFQVQSVPKFTTTSSTTPHDSPLVNQPSPLSSPSLSSHPSPHCLHCPNSAPVSSKRNVMNSFLTSGNVDSRVND